MAEIRKDQKEFKKISLRMIRKGYARLARKEYNVDGDKL